MHGMKQGILLSEAAFVAYLLSSVFSLATRKKAKLRLALTGVSGAGKTMGALIVTDSLRRKESAARGVDSLSFPSLSIVAAA